MALALAISLFISFINININFNINFNLNTNIHIDINVNIKINIMESNHNTHSSQIHLNNLRHVCPPETLGYLVKAKKFPPSRRKYFYRLNGAVLTRHYSDKTDCREKIVVIGGICKPHSHNGFILSLNKSNRVFYAKNSIECNMWMEALLEASTFRLERYYDVKHVVGTGGFAEVRMAVDLETRGKVAVKIINKSGSTTTFLQRELKIMKRLSHVNVVQTLDIFESADKYQIVMEYLSAGSLFDIMSPNQRFHEADVRQLMRQVLKGLAYIHSRGIVHRDLKPENILLCGSSPPFKAKIADFGLSNFHDASSDMLMKTLIGTPQFVAPELVKNEAYGSEVDAWACGIIIFNMLTGVLPFSEHEVLEKYRSGNFKIEYNSSTWKNLSPHAQSLTKMLLCADASRRVNVTAALHHEWFLSHSKEEDIILNPQEMQSKYERLRYLKQLSNTYQNRFRKSVHAVTFLKRLLSKAGMVDSYKFEQIINNTPFIHHHAIDHVDNMLSTQISGASVATESEWDFVVQDIDSESQPNSFRNVPHNAAKLNINVHQIYTNSNNNRSRHISGYVTPGSSSSLNNKTFIIKTPRKQTDPNSMTSICTPSPPSSSSHAQQQQKQQQQQVFHGQNHQQKLMGSPISPASNRNQGSYPKFTSIQSSIPISSTTAPLPSGLSRSESVHVDYNPPINPSGSVSPALQLDRSNTYIEGVGHQMSTPLHNHFEQYRQQQRDNYDSYSNHHMRRMMTESQGMAGTSNVNAEGMGMNGMEAVTPDAIPLTAENMWVSAENENREESCESDLMSKEETKARRRSKIKGFGKRLFGGLRGSRKN